MKIRLLFILLLMSVQSYSQISFSPKHISKSAKFEEGLLKKFKKTTTIFVLSNVYATEVYEKILADSWTVTPYELVKREDFYIENYFSAKYSICSLIGAKDTKHMKSGTPITYLSTYVDLVMYESDMISKKLNELPEKKRAKKKKAIINEHTSRIARFYLYPKDDFIHTVVGFDIATVTYSVYNDEVLYNYKPGFLKNYIQKVNRLLEKEEEYWMYEDGYLQELEKLRTNTLYIPSHMTIEYDARNRRYKEADHSNINEVFEKYEFKYEVIQDSILNAKIMDSQEVYYMRYGRMNTDRFLQIVNSKSGEIVYRNYVTGLSYKIKKKHIAGLNTTIKKASQNITK